MALTYPIVPTQTAAKAPVDEQLMDDIRLNLEDLDSRVSTSGSSDYQFKANGYLNNITKLNRVDGCVVSQSVTLQRCVAMLEYGGAGGTLTIDIKRVTKPDSKITQILRQFSSSINSIARAGSSINTQSVTRATAQVSTQSITQWKSNINISSIILVGNNKVRVNLASQPDSDWKVGDSVNVSSASNALNDGNFTILELNQDGGNNVVFTNASGVEQSGATGTLRLNAWSYNLTNPANAHFAAGESALLASHTEPGNNGTLPIYAINQGGNNIIIKNASGETQGTATGTIDTNRWIFAFSSAAPADYVVGEKALTASHTSGSNDGSFPIAAVNSGGNNVVLYNTAGVVQGGAAGNVNTKRWVVFFSSDPSAQVSTGYNVSIVGASNSLNNGDFEVKQVNRSTSDNVVIYNDAGVAQGGAGGSLVTKRALIKFASDQSATITTLSRITVFGSMRGLSDGDWSVLEVNRGGGSNYNAVVELPSTSVEQVGAAGRVVFESKSVFDTLPSFVIPPKSSGFVGTHGLVTSNAVLNSSRKIIPSGTLLMADIISIPDGSPKNLTIHLI